MYQTLTLTTVSGPGAAQTSAPGLGVPAFGGLDIASQRLGLNPGAGLGAYGQGGLDPQTMMLMQLQSAEQMLDLFSMMLQMGQLMGLTGGNATQALGAAPAGGASGGGAAAPAASTSQTGSTTAATGPVTADVEKIVKTLDAGYQDNARKHFPGILAECKKQGVTDKAQVAYILATTVHESGAGKYMEEIASGSAYEGRRDLGNTQSGDGVRYKGRGYVQITGRNNYSDWSKRLGIDLVGNPELAEKPENAARILVEGMAKGTFTGKKLSDYLGNGKTDFEGARRIVNGTDKASTFANTARKIMAAL